MTPESNADSDPQHNVVAIPDEVFKRIAKAMDDLELDARIQAEQLGITSIKGVYFLATGIGFSEGWKYYGTPFEEAELRAEGHMLERDVDKEYLQAMKEIYSLDLPPCRMMIGCASEH